MKIRFITAAIILINVFLLFQDVPLNLVALTITSLFFSFVIKAKKIRNILKILFLITSMILIRLHFKTLLITECGVTFALILSAIKFWELNEERDHFNMFLILALCECCVFLLNPTFLIFFFGMTKMLFYFYYILKIRNYDVSLLNPKRLIILAAPSIAVSLLLFYTFPRFTQGFVNTSDMQYIISGGSSKMDFKQLGPLSPSSERAFKVYGLEDSGLPFKIIYWRTLVFWQFHKQEWQVASGNLRQDNPVIVDPKLKYEVEVFQNFKEYMPILDGESSIVYANQRFTSYSDRSFRLKTISRSPLSYNVVGNYGDRDKEAGALELRKGLLLKSLHLDRIKRKYFSKATNSPNDQERLKELIQIFKGRDFEYSITPPIYDSLENFLISGKFGYCSHFAAAFVFLARAYNLPARMVSGYLGGEFNPYDNSVVVKELDAHAWVEVFIQEKGWVKVDPTALVAPARLLLSAEEFNNTLNPYIAIFNLKIDRSLFNFSFLNNLSLWLDSLNSKFNSNIFNFDRDKQAAFLRSITPGKMSIGWIFVGALTCSMILFSIVFYFYGKNKVHPNQKRYIKFLKKMNSRGLTKDSHETISHFRTRCLASNPSEANYIDSEVSHYINSFYK